MLHGADFRKGARNGISADPNWRRRCVVLVYPQRLDLLMKVSGCCNDVHKGPVGWQCQLTASEGILLAVPLQGRVKNGAVEC